MIPLLENHLEEVAAVCQRLEVERLEVFGSVLREDFNPLESDLDFIVRFASPRRQGYADRYLELAETLEQLFARPVDLLTERSLRNPILRQALATRRQTIYGT